MKQLEPQVADPCIKGSIGVKSLSKCAPCDEWANAESTWKKWREFVSRTNRMRGKTASHSSSNMSMQYHTNKYLTNIYLRIRKISALPWPAQCPDVNMIENVLLRMNSRVNADTQGLLRHKHQLTERVFEEWRKSLAVVIKQLWHPLQSDFQPLLQQKWFLHKIVF